ncbi:MAG: hypothetical protein HY806_00795 [Nitrospirae bacterium]|nr:hypothetical protein [Nitrospirota bacterium]
MKTLTNFLFFLIIFSFSVQTAYADFKKTKIAVMDFQMQGEKFETSDMGKIVGEWLITALVETGRFDVIERRLLEKILQEQQIGLSGIIDTQSASRLGKVLGVKTIVTGTVTKLSGYTEVNARVISVETGSIITAEKVKASSNTNLDILVSQIGEKIVRAFPLVGYIVNRDGNNATIDVGNLAGVKQGMKFVVYKEGKAIRHPKTGEVLDVETIPTGEIEIKTVKDQTSVGIILKEESPDALSYGDMVRSVVAHFEKLPEIPIKETPAINVDYSLAFEDVEKNLDNSLNARDKVKVYWKTVSGKIVSWTGAIVNIRHGRNKSKILIKSGTRNLSKGYNVTIITSGRAPEYLKEGDTITFTGQLNGYSHKRDLIFEVVYASITK